MKKIETLIEKYGDIDFDPFLSKADYETFYHLSSLRHALLSWYPFQGDASVLEIGGGYGAMTGLYLERCGKVDAVEEDAAKRDALKKRFARTGLRVFDCLEEAEAAGDKYDYVLLIDQPMLYEQNGLESLFAGCRQFLKPGGVLIAGLRNPAGLAYRCGMTDEYVREVFCTQMLPDKNRVMAEAKRVFSHVSLFLPQPNQLFTQAVYTPEELPKDMIGDRVFFFDPFKSPLIMDPNAAYLETLRKGTLAQETDFYLLVMSDVQPKRFVTRAVLSCDRGEYGNQVVFFSDGTVEKSPVTEAGMPHLEKASENLNDLQTHGIRVIHVQRTRRGITMPQIRAPILLSSIAEWTQKKDPDRIRSAFETIYRNILMSSEHAADAEISDDWGLSLKKDSVILKKGYIDLIPFNIFDTKEGFLYFDQEFMTEYCPAVYIMFRAIFYTYLHVPELEELIPQQSMYAQYRITPQEVTVFRQKEEQFVDENRRRQTYAQVSNWAYIDPLRIEQNRRRLQGNIPNDQVKQIQEVQLALLKKFSAFCSENGLVWFAVHGTLLGAARHGGFIPWDDDLDVGMPREDFDRLTALYKNGEGKPFLQTMHTNRRMFYGGYAKLRDDATTGFEPWNRLKTGNKGIWIDILPFDRADSEEEVQKRQKKITFWQRLLYAKIYPPEDGMLHDVPLMRRSVCYAVSRTVLYRTCRKRLERLFRRSKGGSCRAILACYYGDIKNSNICPEKDLSVFEKLPFQDMMIPVPGNWETWLENRYGQFWYILPDEKKRKHQNAFFDTAHSWHEEWRYR